jgi:hypothetical protein
VTVKTPAQLAHERLMQQLRERTRTHKCECKPQPRGHKYSKRDKRGLEQRLRAMEAAGMSRTQMIRDCGTSSKTLVKLLGKIRFTK